MAPPYLKNLKADTKLTLTILAVPCTSAWHSQGSLNKRSHLHCLAISAAGVVAWIVS